ncbi:MAG TPA: hypothetical protein VFW98_03870 [Gemmatimonadaceae bacterium]|nr:hypothetical protein [Gemmatimonadaceae bacterium]
MKISIQVIPSADEPAAVEYRWDTDTAILIASFGNGTTNGAEGMTGSIEFAGQDGSWLILDVQHGAIGSVEVAVWPDVRRSPTLNLPSDVEDAQLIVQTRQQGAAVTLAQTNTMVIAESDAEEQTIHFRLGSSHAVRTVRAARDVLIDLSDRHTIRGIWLLNVPRFPGDS